MQTKVDIEYIDEAIKGRQEPLTFQGLAKSLFQNLIKNNFKIILFFLITNIILYNVYKKIFKQNA
jgi:hypothetical protein